MRRRRVSFAIAVSVPLAAADPANYRRAVLLWGRLLELQWRGRVVLLLEKRLRGKLRWELLQRRVQYCCQIIIEESDEALVRACVRHKFTGSRVHARVDI